MTIDLGGDLIDIRCIERFIGRVLTPLERARPERRAESAHSDARRRVAMEALSKAPGPAPGAHRCQLHG